MAPSPHPSSLTRPKRRRRSAIVAAIFGMLVASAFWGSLSHSSRGTAGSTLKMGLFGSYLTRTRPAGATTATWSIGPWALAGHLAATGGLVVAGVLVTRYNVRRYRFAGGCDGCGYPFPGDPPERCPECGEVWATRSGATAG